MNKVFDQVKFDSGWFDANGTLYIIGAPCDEINGPDDAITEALTTACRNNAGDLPDDFDSEALGLTHVDPRLKRWNEHDGYYHA